MKKFFILILALLLSTFFASIYAQQLSVGLHRGLNLSDIHGNDVTGKWKAKPGPMEGLFIDYSFTQNLGVMTGVDFLIINYEHHPYIDLETPPYPKPLMSSYMPSIIGYYPANEKMDFSFMTLPIQVRLTVPSRPKLNLAAGFYYSILLDSNSDNLYGYQDDTKNDLGFIYTAGLAYPVADRIDAMFNVRYMSGRRAFLENSKFRHGSASFTFGLSYRIIPGKQDESNRSEKQDSINTKIYLSYGGGVNLTWNSCNIFRDKYSYYAGPSLGFNIGLELSPNTYFRTGLSFERQGYSLRDSSDLYHRYYIDGEAIYDVRTKVSTDYLVIPALLEFYHGNSTLFYFNTGPYLGIRLNARCTGTAISDESREGVFILTETTVNNDLEQFIKKKDFGWVAGAGIALPISENYLLDIGLKFRQGLIDVYDSSNMPEEARPMGNDILIRNSSLSLQVVLRVPVYK